MQRQDGLIHILTGEGNGKTTSAVGIAVRAVGRGYKVAFVQFLKSGLSGEIPSLEQLGATVITKTKHCPAYDKHLNMMTDKGFVIFCKDCFVINEQDKALTLGAFESAKHFATSGEYGLVVMDEIFWAIKEKLVTEAQLLSLIEHKHPSCELILTGRGATKPIEEKADYVTYVEKKKHPFDRGVLSRAGVDY